MPPSFSGKCLKCNKIMLYQPDDKIPMCDECKEKVKTEFQTKIRPDAKNVELHSKYYEPGPEPEEEKDGT
jgi:hypothetical protein